ncbi:MAG: SPOR domain-containing protein [Prevotellaceae bacterium]|nr:SPOR domain-containing protein [Prevotellaceae bacterium]
MFRQTVAFSVAILLSSVAAAQESFTQKLQRQMANQGIVVLHHDAEIDAAVNGSRPSSSHTASSGATTTAGSSSGNASTSSSSAAAGKKVRMNGYRIQVYVGGNSRDAKYKAQQMENKVLSYYPDIATYTRFVSPRWICHVGDFKTHDEAVELLTDLRNKGGFDEAIIVKCKINASAD